MEFLKWTGYTLITIVGLCLVIGIGAILSAIGAVVGIIAIGALVVFIITVMVREFIEGS